MLHAQAHEITPPSKKRSTNTSLVEALPLRFNLDMAPQQQSRPPPPDLPANPAPQGGAQRDAEMKDGDWYSERYPVIHPDYGRKDAVANMLGMYIST